jgi:hypothetical protein
MDCLELASLNSVIEDDRWYAIYLSDAHLLVESLSSGGTLGDSSRPNQGSRFNELRSRTIVVLRSLNGNGYGNNLISETAIVRNRGAVVTPNRYEGGSVEILNSTVSANSGQRTGVSRLADR